MSKEYQGARLANGLYYTDDEILCSYKDAKDKREQMLILAQMNLCTTEDIRDALIRAGIDKRALPRKSKNQTQQVESTSESTPTPEVVEEVQTASEALETLDTEPVTEEIPQPQKSLSMDSLEVLKLADNALTVYQSILMKQKTALESEISKLEEPLSKYKEKLSKCVNELAIIDKLISRDL